LATKFSLLPFLNPQITEDQWPVSSILALVASGVTYNLSQRFQKPRAARYLAIAGLVISVISTVTLLAIVGGLILSMNPEFQNFSARSMFVLMFLGIGLAIGYCFARIL
jgi:cytochrome b subunit of formate dehydrogenase